MYETISYDIEVSVHFSKKEKCRRQAFILDISSWARIFLLIVGRMGLGGPQTYPPGLPSVGRVPDLKKRQRNDRNRLRIVGSSFATATTEPSLGRTTAFSRQRATTKAAQNIPERKRDRACRAIFRESRYAHRRLRSPTLSLSSCGRHH